MRAVTDTLRIGVLATTSVAGIRSTCGTTDSGELAGHFSTARSRFLMVNEVFWSGVDRAVVAADGFAHGLANERCA
jgi:hypothetical protein